MKPQFSLAKGYECPECSADVEAASGPDFISVWRCRNCDWGTVQDTYDPNTPDELTKREKFNDD
jgi:ribosomal protein L37AE/L43A